MTISGLEVRRYMGQVIDISEKRGITEVEEEAPRNRVIALSGWKGSGKDTIADHLVLKYGYTKLSFASVLKDMVAELYNIPRSHMDDQSMKEKPILSLPVIDSDPFSARIHEMLRSEFRDGYWTPRALCILEGSVKRSVYSNYWVKRVADKMQADPNGRFVISDMRYKTEADTLSMILPRRDLLIMRVNRFETVNTEDPSERNLDDYNFDVIFGNHFPTIPELHSTLDFACTTLGLVPK